MTEALGAVASAGAEALADGAPCVATGLGTVVWAIVLPAAVA